MWSDYCSRSREKEKTSTGGISIIIDVLQSRLHTLAHTDLNMTAPTEHDKFHNVEKGRYLTSRILGCSASNKAVFAFERNIRPPHLCSFGHNYLSFFLYFRRMPCAGRLPRNSSPIEPGLIHNMLLDAGACAVIYRGRLP